MTTTIRPDFRPAFTLIFLAVFAFTLVIDLHVPVTGDTSGVGLAGLALSVDPLLQHMGYPITDPYIIDLAIATPLQIMSGYSVLVLQLTGYLFFLALLTAMAGVVYWATSNKLMAFVVVVLVLSMGATTQLFLMLPLFHWPTLTIGFCYMVLFYNIDQRQKRFLVLPLLFSLVLLFSDLVFLAFFVIPFTTWSLYKWHTSKNHYNTMVSIAVFYLGTVSTYLFKLWSGMCISKDLATNPVSSIADNLYSLLCNVFGNFSMLYTAKPNILVGLVFVCWSLAVLSLVCKLDYKRLKEPRTFYIVSLLIVGCLVIACGFLSVKTFTYGRFLIFISLSMVIFAALLYPVRSRLVWVALTVVLVSSFIFNVSYMVGMEDLNAENYKLIGVLHDNNVSYGYADFEVANPITYLTAGEITLVNCNFDQNNASHVTLLEWLTEARWHQYNRSGVIIQYRTEGSTFFSEHPPTRTVVVDDYNLRFYDVLPF